MYWKNYIKLDFIIFITFIDIHDTSLEILENSYLDNISGLFGDFQMNELTKDRERKFLNIEYLCKNFDCGRGIWKQIDENRELLEFLKKEAPELWVKDDGFRGGVIELWIADNDLFLNCILHLVEINKPEQFKNCCFPRKWPQVDIKIQSIDYSDELSKIISEDIKIKSKN